MIDPPPVVVPIIPGHAASRPPTELEELGHFVYTAGFLHAAWADTILTLPNLPPLRLHSLFLSRSPVFYQLLVSTNAPPPYNLHMDLEDSELSTVSVSTALATLYGHSIELQTCDLGLARGLVAAGAHFGLERVARRGYELLVKSLKVETLAQLFEFALKPSALKNGIVAKNKGPYPPFTEGLLDVLVSFVLQGLDASKSFAETEPVLQQVLIGLPLDVLKLVLENAQLKAPNSRERLRFAKAVVAARGLNEQVVLAIGSTNGIIISKRS